MEITDDHKEWATVHRMREMLASVRRDYEITQTYTLFTTILCWTLQRIRSKRQDHDSASGRMAALCEELDAQPLPEFLPRRLRRPLRVVHHDRHNVETANDFSVFAENGEDFSVLRALVALRNAVAHGDARRVLPLNNSGRLVGYELLCEERQDRKVVWEGSIKLNRLGMSGVADALADRYCAAVAAPYSTPFREDASSLLEAGRA